MANKLITYSFIAAVFLVLAAPRVYPEVRAQVNFVETPSDKLQTQAPLASQLANQTLAPSEQQTDDTKDASQPVQRHNFYSEKAAHSLSQMQLQKFNNLYLSGVPEKSDVISPVIKRCMGERYDLFTANYRVQSPLVWTGDILAGWGMLPHSGGSSRAEFFIHRDGSALVVITLEDEQFHFGAKRLLQNAYVAQELATSAQAH